MTFDEMLEQVITLLKRQGRVSYRALKRRFDLDEDYLEDVKVELIKAQHLARDEDGEILVWVGEAEGAAISSSPSLQAEPPPPAPHDQPSQGAPSPTAPHVPEAERRQLTVMFCDLVDSTHSHRNSTQKSIGTSSVHIRGCVPKLSSAMMDTLHSY